jgi:hypothetical protein
MAPRQTDVCIPSSSTTSTCIRINNINHNIGHHRKNYLNNHNIDHHRNNHLNNHINHHTQEEMPSLPEDDSPLNLSAREFLFTLPQPTPQLTRHRASRASQQAQVAPLERSQRFVLPLQPEPIFSLPSLSTIPSQRQVQVQAAQAQAQEQAQAQTQAQTQAQAQEQIQVPVQAPIQQQDQTQAQQGQDEKKNLKSTLDTFPFLRLSAELRNKIYAHSIIRREIPPTTTTITAGDNDDDNEGEHAIIRINAAHTLAGPREPVVAACSRQLRKEALGVFYRDSVFAYEETLGTFGQFASTRLARFLRRIGPVRCGQLRKLRVEMPRAAEGYEDEWMWDQAEDVADDFMERVCLMGVDLRRVEVVGEMEEDVAVVAAAAAAAAAATGAGDQEGGEDGMGWRAAWAFEMRHARDYWLRYYEDSENGEYDDEDAE